MRRPFVLLTLLALSAVRAHAQHTGLHDSVTVVPGQAYAKGGLYRFFFGTRYRDLWTTPVRVPVLDLAVFAGGLKPIKKGGGEQTKSLRFLGADGLEYAFRSVFKDASAVLPVELRETFADRILQDQMSSGHPAGPLVVAPILRAAGVLHAEPVLVIMPDDPALGEFRPEFANLLGMIEVRPRQADEEGMGFAGAKEVVGYDDFVKRLDKKPTVRLDSRAFLIARLTDVFLGDWDRHRDQWRWALLEDSSGSRWLPIPRDRDQAFVTFDGLLLSLVQMDAPQLLKFGPKYGPIVGATWNGRDLDRRFLTDLEWPAWDSAARQLQRVITDSVIEFAARQMPPEFYKIDGPRMTAALRARRDHFPEMARTYYDLLVGEVDVFASDRDDVARVTRVDDRYVDVTVADGEEGKVYYRRRFDSHETKDVRVYLQGGNDRAVVDGPGEAGITVRLIGGGGNDTFADSSARGGAHFYDSRGTNPAAGGSIDKRPYRAIDDTNPTSLPHRDWGRRTLTEAFLGLAPDEGLLVAVGGHTSWYGFRKKPRGSRLDYQVSVATGAATGRLDLAGRFQKENSGMFLGFESRASGIEVLRWYGFGNDTPFDPTQPSSFNRVTQQVMAFEPLLGFSWGTRSEFRIGPSIKYSSTPLGGNNALRFIGQHPPYGTGRFVQSALRFDLESDTRDSPLAARRGAYLGIGGSYVPGVLDVERSFGEVHGRLATYLTVKMPTQPTLALQVGGKKLWGRTGKIPFFEAAQIGPSPGLRGYQIDRFAGEASVYTMAELRLQLTRMFILIPGQQGIFGFYDGGRVFVRGEDSNTWHSGVGGGVWVSFLTRANVLSAAIGHSKEGNRLYVRFGFGF